MCRDVDRLLSRHHWDVELREASFRIQAINSCKQCDVRLAARGPCCVAAKDRGVDHCVLRLAKYRWCGRRIVHFAASRQVLRSDMIHS